MLPGRGFASMCCSTYLRSSSYRTRKYSIRPWNHPQYCGDDKTETIYARRMGQPTQRATNYTARSTFDTAQIFLHANGQRPKRAPIRQRSRRRQRRGEPHTEDGLGVLEKTFIIIDRRKVPGYASGGRCCSTRLRSSSCRTRKYFFQP